MLWRSLPLLLLLKTPYPSAVKTPALSRATVNLTMMPGAEFEKKDSKAVETLSPANRDARFAGHTLPEHIRYYSVMYLPDPENISDGLPHSHKKPNVMERRPQRQPAGVLRRGDSRLDRTGVL